MKLNLGCSDHIMPGFVNVDIHRLEGVDLVHDLDTMPWPWADGSVGEVFCAHTLEHLLDPLAAMREIRRVLTPGGKLTVIVPNAAGYMAHYPGHHHLFGETWFYAFADSGDNQEDLSGLFTDVKIELRLFHHRPPAKVSALVPALRLWERFWNRSRMRQIFWETLGIMVPGEVWFTASKRKESET